MQHGAQFSITAAESAKAAASAKIAGNGMFHISRRVQIKNLQLNISISALLSAKRATKIIDMLGHRQDGRRRRNGVF
jgi:hypothetical protein